MKILKVILIYVVHTALTVALVLTLAEHLL